MLLCLTYSYILHGEVLSAAKTEHFSGQTNKKHGKAVRPGKRGHDGFRSQAVCTRDKAQCLALK